MTSTGNGSPLEQLADVLPLLHVGFHEIDERAGALVGLTETQRQLLECLSGKVLLSNSQLCVLLGRVQSSVSELTDRLVQRGLITREPHRDRRKSNFKLTPDGARALAEFNQVRARALSSRLASYSDESMVRLVESLGHLAQALRRPGAVAGGESDPGYHSNN